MERQARARKAEEDRLRREKIDKEEREKREQEEKVAQELQRLKDKAKASLMVINNYYLHLICFTFFFAVEGCF